MPGARAELLRVARVSGVLWAGTLAVDRLAPVGIRRLWAPRVVPANRLAAQLGEIFRAWGMPEEQRAIVVEKILYADLRGIDSHGCCMLPFYQRLRDEGRLCVAPHIEVVQETATTALLDGGGGLGHVPATHAMGRAIEKCRTGGVAAVAVRRSGHFGAAGAYASMAADAGLIGIVTTSTPTPAVVPAAGREARLGTNPIALAAPAGRHAPFLLDMATSAASLGKLHDRWRGGRSVPEGWALDRRGRPTRNGRVAAAARRLLPLGGDIEHGGHKGYGLAAAVEILSSVLPGVHRGDASETGGRSVGHFFLAIDPARFRPAGEFATDLDTLIDSLHETPAVDPAEPVLVAGEPEQRTLARRAHQGIPLARGVFEDLRGVAHAAGVPFLLEERA